ncbi:hypothetical protein GYMLUDRAFT_65404 [Collybiopsis luxurians FD-317 M1]|uniref:Uncharacterized protein n=1 Tax=Collybiopsis luxurians FD-317 M1 TaxID=944289 RepID=A0A0D0C5Z2_9AGAR|nr:hypothetical protein GYMLUDRAFT_65404 [Collybiopsis luxurians FD-317 M1]
MWLKSKAALFAQAQENHTVGDFWLEIYCSYWALFPLPGMDEVGKLSDDQTEELSRKMVQNKSATRNKTKSINVIIDLANGSSTAVMSTGPVPKKSMQLCAISTEQVFQSLFSDELVKPLVDTEKAKLLEATGVRPGCPGALMITQKHTKATWASASKETCQAVFSRMRELKAEKEAWKIKEEEDEEDREEGKASDNATNKISRLKDVIAAVQFLQGEARQQKAFVKQSSEHKNTRETQKSRGACCHSSMIISREIIGDHHQPETLTAVTALANSLNSQPQPLKTLVPDPLAMMLSTTALTLPSTLLHLMDMFLDFGSSSKSLSMPDLQLNLSSPLLSNDSVALFLRIHLLNNSSTRYAQKGALKTKTMKLKPCPCKRKSDAQSDEHSGSEAPSKCSKSSAVKWSRLSKVIENNTPPTQTAKSQCSQHANLGNQYRELINMQGALLLGTIGKGIVTCRPGKVYASPSIPIQI